MARDVYQTAGVEEKRLSCSVTREGFVCGGTGCPCLCLGISSKRDAQAGRGRTGRDTSESRSK